jgi:ubiquinone/menaquinone biosynthesis C-methylase UbiE
MAAIWGAIRRLNPRQGDLILDAGCGTGLTIRGYFRAGIRVVGLDLSRKSLDVCAAKRRDPGILLVRGDLAALPFSDGVFDKVLCANAIQHLPSQRLRRTCVQELTRVLRPGGNLVISTHNFSLVKRKQGWVKEGRPGGGTSGSVQYIYRIDAKELHQLLAEFIDVEAICGAGLRLPYRWKLSSISRLLERLLSHSRLGQARGNMLVAVGAKPTIPELKLLTA